MREGPNRREQAARGFEAGIRGEARPGRGRGRASGGSRVEETELPRGRRARRRPEMFDSDRNRVAIVDARRGGGRGGGPRCSTTPPTWPASPAAGGTQHDHARVRRGARTGCGRDHRTHECVIEANRRAAPPLRGSAGFSWLRSPENRTLGQLVELERRIDLYDSNSIEAMLIDDWLAKLRRREAIDRVRPR